MAAERNWASRMRVENDTFAVLRAGTDAGWGVGIVCGAGMNCVGVAPRRPRGALPGARADHGRLGRRRRHRAGGAVLGRTERGRPRSEDAPRAARARTLRVRRPSRSRRPSIAGASERRLLELRRSCSSSPRTTPSPPRSSTRLVSEIVAFVRVAAATARLTRKLRRGARRRPAAARRAAGRGRDRAAVRAAPGGRPADGRPAIVGAALLGLDELGVAARRTRRARGAESETVISEARWLRFGTSRRRACIRAPTARPSTRSTSRSRDGEFMVLVGPSGPGKTTALRMLAGLEEVDAGAICIGDRDVTYALAEGARRRDGVPELCAVPVPHRRGEHRASRCGSRASRRQSASAACARSAKMLGLVDVPRAQAGRSSPAASGSASPWAARSSASRACS